ncbi:MAG TPA: DUF423 domain-containing protein [Chthoniobacteraceae bacterium]|jgi:uncharacterized membrane protein YgdD (TMEM256/DUF423 family)
MKSPLPFRVAAISGFLAVAFGAFGAHGLKDLLARYDTSAIWQTAALYHLVHSAVLLFVAGREPLPAWAFRLFAAGILVFSGSLYVLSVTNVRWLGAITPLGGLALLGGWIALAFSARVRQEP